jgi:hypothetical protein
MQALRSHTRPQALKAVMEGVESEALQAAGKKTRGKVWEVERKGSAGGGAQTNYI